MADVTSHTADKFDMSKVNDASLLNYRAELESKEKTAVETASKVNTIIASVNGANNEEANLAT